MIRRSGDDDDEEDGDDGPAVRHRGPAVGRKACRRLRSAPDAQRIAPEPSRRRIADELRKRLGGRFTTDERRALRRVPTRCRRSPARPCPRRPSLGPAIADAALRHRCARGRRLAGGRRREPRGHSRRRWRSLGARRLHGSTLRPEPGTPGPVAAAGKRSYGPLGARGRPRHHVGALARLAPCRGRAPRASTRAPVLHRRSCARAERLCWACSCCVTCACVALVCHVLTAVDGRADVREGRRRAGAAAPSARPGPSARPRNAERPIVTRGGAAPRSFLRHSRPSFLPHAKPAPASLPEPALSAGTRSGPGTPRRRRAPPRSAGAGCTSPPGPSATARRS